MNFKHAVKVGLKVLKANAPTLEMVTGVGLMFAAGGILVSFAEDIAEVNERVRSAKEEVKLVDHDPDGWKDMGETKKQYIRRTTKEIAADYIKTTGPAFAVGAIGAGLIIHSHTSIEAQLKATAASLASLSLAFSTYRGRVIADAGEEKDLYYYTGYSVNHAEVVDCETGEVKEVPSVVETDTGKPIRNGFRFTQEDNTNWQNSPAANYNFLMSTLDAVNFQLGVREEMSLNDILKPFGVRRKAYGQAVGAFKYEPDGSINTIRFNPTLMQNLINGVSPDCECLLEYDDGRPLVDDILNDPRNIWEKE